MFGDRLSARISARISTGQVEMLERVLEVDTAHPTVLSRLFSAHRRTLLEELEAVSVLRRRIEAVKFTSSHKEYARLFHH